jgi:hypothetical protein
MGSHRTSGSRLGFGPRVENWQTGRQIMAVLGALGGLEQ